MSHTEAMSAGQFAQLMGDAEAYTAAIKRFLEGALDFKGKIHSRARLREVQDGAMIEPAWIAKAPRVAKTSADLLKAAGVVAGRRDIRSYLNGVKAEAGRLLATDGHRALVLRADTADILSAHEGVEGDVIIGHDGALIAGRFPDLDRAIPMDSAYADGWTVDVDSARLGARLRGLRKARRFIDELVSVEVMMPGMERPALFNLDYLLDMAETFQRLGHARFTLCLSAYEDRPLRAESPDGIATMVIMPMRGADYLSSLKLRPVGAEVLWTGAAWKPARKRHETRSSPAPVDAPMDAGAETISSPEPSPADA